MEVTTLAVGQLKTNCFLVFDEKTKECVIIDPGDDADYIVRKVFDEDLSPKKIIATHGHFDHVMAVYELQKTFGIPFFMHKKDEFLLSRMNSSVKYFLGVDSALPISKVDKYLKVDQNLTINHQSLAIILTPGHTPGGIALYSKKEKCAFVGDLLFAGGGVGRADFSYSNEANLQKSIKKILKLPKETKLYCGHGDSTSVAELKQLSF